MPDILSQVHVELDVKRSTAYSGDGHRITDRSMIEYWLVTAEEGDYVHKRACSTHDKACQQAWRWEDDCLDNIQIEHMFYPASQDDIPF